MAKIAGSTVVLPESIAADISIVFEDGKITALEPGGSGAEYFDNSVILPGFIDLHTHGRLGQGIDQLDSDLLLKYARTGTTSFLPTYGSRGTLNEMQWLDRVDDLKKNPKAGVAEVLGAHLEGPFIDPVNRGGINEKDCLVPTEEMLQAFLAAPGLRYMTVSPYVDGALDVIKKLSDNAIICVSGHTRGRPGILEGAVDAGLKGVCHFLNNNTRSSDVFKEAGVRKPTIDEMALLHDDLFLEIICDLQHVDPVFIKIAYRLKGPSRIAVITDSISASGMPEGIYEHHDGRKYEIKDGGVHECATGGRFGSCVNQVEEFGNLIEKIGVALHEAARMCALTPAEILGVDSRKGSLEVGKDADILVVDRDTYEVIAVYVKGARVAL